MQHMETIYIIHLKQDDAKKHNEKVNKRVMIMVIMLSKTDSLYL